MRWEEAHEGWMCKRLTQEEAAHLLGICARTFRRYIDRYEEEGLDGLVDKRLAQVSQSKAPVDEVVRLETLYKQRYDGWNVKHFFERYQDEHKGERSYNWVRKRLQTAGLVETGKRRGPQSIGILTGMFGQQVEYRNGSVAFSLHERVKPLCK